MITMIRVKAEDGSSSWSLLRNRKARELDEYDFLIEAICKQAARDLKSVSFKNRIDAMDFFRSRWFEYLTNLDGEEIIQELLRRD